MTAECRGDLASLGEGGWGRRREVERRVGDRPLGENGVQEGGRDTLESWRRK